MEIDFDPAKSQRNAELRGLNFDLAHKFNFITAMVYQDNRKNYSEDRFVAIGFIADRLHVICYARIPGGIRVISLRKANKREVKQYEGR